MDNDYLSFNHPNGLGSHWLSVASRLNPLFPRRNYFSRIFLEKDILRYSFNIPKTRLNVTFEKFILMKAPIIVILQDEVAALIS